MNYGTRLQLYYWAQAQIEGILGLSPLNNANSSLPKPFFTIDRRRKNYRRLDESLRTSANKNTDRFSDLDILYIDKNILVNIEDTYSTHLHAQKGEYKYNVVHLCIIVIL